MHSAKFYFRFVYVSCYMSTCIHRIRTSKKTIDQDCLSKPNQNIIRC